MPTSSGVFVAAVATSVSSQASNSKFIPLAQAKSVLTQFARFAETMPDELSVWMFTRKAPPFPLLPEHVHGTEIVALALC